MPALLSKCLTAACLAGLVLSSGACRGRSALTSDDINGFSADQALFSFFGTAEGQDIDFDNDDVNDTQANITIVFTDRKSLCRDLKNPIIAGNEDNIDDMVLFVINARIVESGSDRNPLRENDIIIRNEANDDVDARFKVREEGQTRVTADTQNDSEEIELHLLGVGGDRLAGTIEANVNFTNSIGDQDVSKISGYFAARHCKALDAIALTGGL
jgi:hypothetical protein